MKKDLESTCSNPKPKVVVAANPQTNYDVFVSFRGEDRGEDIRHAFLSNLVAAFDRTKIKPSVDYRLERGEKTWPAIVRAIEESSISLIIFSKYYATSRWCLNELVHILKCSKKYGRIAIPVFYRVKAGDVKGSKKRKAGDVKEAGDVKDPAWTYEDALAELGKEYSSTMVRSWRGALKKSVDLLGIKSSEFGNDDALLIDEIVRQVLSKLNSSNNSVNSSGLIGIDKHIARVESLLNKNLEGTRFIGIWGIGGIGKTTIAEAIFNKLRSVYGGYCFLQNVREESAKHGKHFLKEKLFSKLLGEKVELDNPNGLPDHVKRRVKHMKVLIVLDDVNNSNQLEILDGHGDWFRSGSTVIITTRNKQVVPAEGDYIHEVGALDFDEALELFNLNAFKQDHVKMMEYCELSKKVLNYAKGIPLVLIVLARRLRGKPKKIWRSLVDQLENMPLEEVYESLKLSYDDLGRKEKKIFLDLACFLVGLNLKMEHIKALLKERENDNSVVYGLERLKDKALITLSEDDGISMHDIIQEMAWEIVSRECPEDPGRHSRLGHPDDIYQVLQNDKGSEAIRSIKVPLTAISKLKLSPHIFAKMSKLQFLHVPFEYDQQDGMDLLPQGLQSLPTELRYLVWMQYPLKSLPQSFSVEKLVILDLSFSKLKKLWCGVQNLVNLKEVQLHHSYFLKELPDFSKATNLEVLNIQFCKQLTNLHPSIFSLEKLDKLHLGYCKFRLPAKIHLRSLSYLNLRGFKNISEYSVTISENMIELNLAYTRVIALAAPFGNQSKLEYLYLRGCYYIKSLPSCFNKFTKLTVLDIWRCNGLKTLPELPSSLEILYANDCTSLETILFPSSDEQFKENRKKVEFWNCLKLDEHSLVAIGLNAQINMMKFARKHFLARDDPVDNFQAKYVYPGSSVPEWFVYKTTEDFIVIDLYAPNSPILGFIFCFVLGDLPPDAQFKFSITICDDEGEGKVGTVEMWFSKSDIDHVCVIYDQKISRSLISRARNLRRHKIKVAMEHIYSLYPRGPRVETTVRIRGLGVYPISTTPHHDFIQEME